jgi:hypothetical protein
MKKLLLILLCLPMIGFGQLTYVPDDVFEEYIEINIPLADNGLVNDNYVLTAGLDMQTNGIAYLSGIVISGATLSNATINDFTGIEDFINLPSIKISNLNSAIIDLSQVELELSPSALASGFTSFIDITSCPLVTDIILPSDSFGLHLGANTYLTNITFQDSTFFKNTTSGYALVIDGCNSLTSIDMSNILGVLNGSFLRVESNLNLTQLNLKNGFCYNWDALFIQWNTNLFCIQVDDPIYSSIAAQWFWQEFYNDPTQYSYSNNCGWPTNIEEHTTNKELLKITDLLGRETKQTNQPLFYIYDDGTVEKRIIIE